MQVEHSEAIWKPKQSHYENSQMAHFISYVSGIVGTPVKDYWELHSWSVSHFEEFWKILCDYLQIKWHKNPTKIYLPSLDRKIYGGKWFSSGRLNYCEHLLEHQERHTAITSICEGRQDRSISNSDLKVAVAACAQYLKDRGVTIGDRVAGVVPNTIEAVVAMLATSSLGAVWSSCSPDFGQQGILDRFSQINPKVLFFARSYQYNGKTIDCHGLIEKVQKGLPTLDSIVLIDILDDKPFDGLLSCEWTSYAAIQKQDIIAEIEYASLAFDAPLFIMFSSGTTGVPKCIVHSVGGTLVQHLKELRLHCDLKPGKKILYFTTCGWMMWNWMVTALATGAEIVLYEGSPGFPDLYDFWQVAEKYEVQILGTSPKFLASCSKSNVIPASKFAFSNLETILSTGAPLLSEQYDWIRENVGESVQVCSISGGTDIISCFMLGNPVLPVFRGEIQCPGLGMDIESWKDGKKVDGQKGELVCKKPFPSMPIGFWNDTDGSKYKKAYFEHYPKVSVWYHGDFISISSHRGIVVHGRSDATLNPGGVRIGTAEIYRVVENLEDIADSLAASRQVDGDVEICLFVKLVHGSLNDEIKQRIKNSIRQELTPRHVPSKIFEVDEIPYTRSGKKLELAVTQILNGEMIANESAISNPNSLEKFRSCALTFKSI